MTKALPHAFENDSQSLSQIPNVPAFFAIDFYGACGWVNLSSKDFEKGRFSSAVWSNDRSACSGFDFKVEMLKHLIGSAKNIRVTNVQYRVFFVCVDNVKIPLVWYK